MRILVAAILICALPACGEARPSGEPRSGEAIAKTDEPSMPPVLDSAAPTVADLERRGLVRTDDEPTGWSCGPDCTADGFTAVYMGKDAERGDPDRRFVCPVASGEMESWKCRPVETAPGSSVGGGRADG